MEKLIDPMTVAKEQTHAFVLFFSIISREAWTHFIFYFSTLEQNRLEWSREGMEYSNSWIGL